MLQQGVHGEQALWRWVQQICDAGDSEQMLLATAGFLRTWISCDLVWRTELRLTPRAARVLVSDGHNLVRDVGLGAALAASGDQHPAVLSYMRDPSDLTPRRVSDVSTARTWLSSPAYQDLAPAQGRYQLSLVTKLDTAVGEGWILLRQRSDFTTTDVETATFILPSLIAIDRLMGARNRVPLSSQDNPGLSTREHEVLLLLARGLTAVAIARQLGIAPATARKHLERVYEKLGRHDRLTAITYARQVGLVPAG